VINDELAGYDDEPAYGEANHPEMESRDEQSQAQHEAAWDEASLGAWNRYTEGLPARNALERDLFEDFMWREHRSGRLRAQYDAEDPDSDENTPSPGTQAPRESR
jgi:hypothetical protein